MKKIKLLKAKIMEVSARSREGHIPSAFSVMDLLWVLYDRVLNVSPETVSDPDRDIFILSKGHASLGLYAILLEKGFVDQTAFDDFGKLNNCLGGHPDRTKVGGIEASTGSLGHGLPMAVGVALGIKIKNKKNKVYTIVGDGECNEGTIWESAMLASHHGLNNLCCIIDNNGSSERALRLGNLAEKFSAFGWDTDIIDGHDHAEIYRALKRKPSDRPRAIIANTIKGKGCKVMENNPEWHHKSPTSAELAGIIAALY